MKITIEPCFYSLMFIGSVYISKDGYVIGATSTHLKAFEPL